MRTCTRLSLVISRVTLFASLSLSMAAVSCGTDEGPATPSDPTVGSALTIQNDWEDGSTQGWFPFGSPTLTNSTEQALTGTHSLKTTNRTATFMGPATSLTGKLSPGTNYRVSVAVRLVAGQAPTTVKVTVQRSMSDGTTAFDQVVGSTSVTDAAWVTLSGNYSYTATNV